MTGQETKLEINAVMNRLDELLRPKYENRTVEKLEVYYDVDKDMYFRPFTIETWDAVGIEYAHGEQEAKAYCYEDGELFYLADYDSIDALMKDILQEIEQ